MWLDNPFETPPIVPATEQLVLQIRPLNSKMGNLNLRKWLGPSKSFYEEGEHQGIRLSWTA
jgi:hypothetical protein